MSARIIDLGQTRSVQEAAIHAAERYGCSHREAKQAAKQGLHLMANGASAARAIGEAIRYAAQFHPDDPEAA